MINTLNMVLSYSNYTFFNTVKLTFSPLDYYLDVSQNTLGFNIQLIYDKNGNSYEVNLIT